MLEIQIARYSYSRNQEKYMLLVGRLGSNFDMKRGIKGVLSDSFISIAPAVLQIFADLDFTCDSLCTGVRISP
jgi:hypothetical protein